MNELTIIFVKELANEGLMANLDERDNEAKGEAFPSEVFVEELVNEGLIARHDQAKGEAFPSEVEVDFAYKTKKNVQV